MVQLSNNVQLNIDEIEFSGIRAQGAGGQNVNKVSSAIHCRFDIAASSLPEFYKERLLNYRDARITSDGIVIIKAQRFRTQEKNRADAIERLEELITSATMVQKKRRPTRPSKSARNKRMDAKTRRGAIKSNRSKVDY